ncbi:MAG: small-conductance mechanosensitive channel [Candidatus Promineifilaceae bacterium]
MFGWGELLLLGAPVGAVEGVIESINLRTMLIRARSGEPIVVPNREIRVVINFSHALFSESNIKIRIHSKDAHRAIDLLGLMASEAVLLLDELTEPWIVISETGEMG